MKITNLGKFIGTIGFSIIIISTIQWFFLYQDISQLSLGVSIGIIFVGFSYLHCWMRNTESEIKETNTAIDAMRIWALQEFDNLKGNEKLIKSEEE